MLRLISSVFSLLAVAGGGYWYYHHNPEVKNLVNEYLHQGEFHTLEVRYSAEEIMAREKKQLIKTPQHSFLPAVIKFHPYALMEVKYSADQQTKEGVMLWSLVDGELILNTENWQSTHGFADCINAKATKEEFRLLNLLSRKGGHADREMIIRDLKMENDVLDRLVEGCRQKKLLVQKGNQYRLHFSNPRLALTPETKLDQWLVSKSYTGMERAEKRFSLSEIEKVACNAFDSDFTIRHTTEIYLPIYVIGVQNPDGSVMTTQWNALNGKRVTSGFVIAP